MIIDTGAAAIMVVVLLALLGLAVGWGTLRERVSNIRNDVNSDREENRDDHKRMLEEVGEIRKSLSRK